MMRVWRSSAGRSSFRENLQLQQKLSRCGEWQLGPRMTNLRLLDQDR